MVEYVSEVNIREYEAFLARHPRGSYLQSRGWAAQNPKWHWRAVLCRDSEGYITGAASVLLREVSLLPYQMMYCCRGPVCDPEDTATLRELLSGLSALAEEESVCLVRLDPPFVEGEHEVMNVLAEFRYSVIHHKKLPPAQPRRDWTVLLRKRSWDQLRASFSPEHQQCINMAIRNGIEINHGKRVLVPVYSDLSRQAALRSSMPMHEQDYYMGLTENQNTDIYIACSDSRPVAGAVMINFGGVFCCASMLDLSDPGTKASYLLRAVILQGALERGCTACVFPGAPADEGSPEYQFEAGFGGATVAYFGEMDWVRKPISGRLSKWFDVISARSSKFRYFLKER